MNETLLMSQGVAKRFQLIERFLQHDRTHNRTIPYIKINRLVRYDMSDLQELIKRLKKEGMVR